MSYRSILFADLRNFTSFCENRTPEHIFKVLEETLGLQARIVEEHGGEVDKFIGDCVMATFSNEVSAFNAAREIIELSRKLLKVRGYEDLCPGVGIHSGNVAVGVVGYEALASYTSIGDAVNIASRLCGIAHAGEIVMSASAIEMLPPKLRRSFSQYRTSEVKGRQGGIRISSLFPVTRHVSGASTQHMTIQLSKQYSRVKSRNDSSESDGFTPQGLE